MSQKIPAGLGTAAGAFLAAGLIALATGPLAHADGDDGSPGADADFIDHITNFGLFTDTAAADPDDNFAAMVLHLPFLGITDVLTSGIDPSDELAKLVPGLPDDTGIGMAGATVNTLVSSMDPALDSSFVIPFTDPLSMLWADLIPLGF